MRRSPASNGGLYTAGHKRRRHSPVVTTYLPGPGGLVLLHQAKVEAYDDWQTVANPDTKPRPENYVDATGRLDLASYHQALAQWEAGIETLRLRFNAAHLAYEQARASHLQQLADA